MPEGYIILTSNQPPEPRAERFARGEKTEHPPPPIIVTLPGLPPRTINVCRGRERPGIARLRRAAAPEPVNPSSR